MENVALETEKAISRALKIDEKEIQDHIDDLVRQSVEDTLNALLNAEADAICNAGRYQRTPDRLDTRASYHRKLLTKAGEVDLKVLPGFASESALRNGDHLALLDQAELRGGSSDRDVSDRRFCLAGGGHHGSAVGCESQSQHRQQPQSEVYGKIEEWRMRPINEEHPYVFVDGVYLKRSWGGEVQNVSALVADRSIRMDTVRFWASPRKTARTRSPRATFCAI